MNNAVAGLSSNMTDIIQLNVGGKRFTTSRQTLLSIPDSFFSSMLSGRISTHRDETGAIFIDRDPYFFGKILNYLRTKEIQLSDTDIHGLRHEAEYYGISPLIRRLLLCEELEQPSCGGLLFHGTIAVPSSPFPDFGPDKRQSLSSIEAELVNIPSSILSDSRRDLSRARHGGSWLGDARSSAPVNLGELRRGFRPSGAYSNHPLRVTIIKGHFNWLAVAFPHFVSLYRLKESIGWNLTWTSPYIDLTVEHITLNAKVMNPGQDGCCRMLAANYGSVIQLWQISDNGQKTREVGTFSLTVGVNSLFFIGSHLVALSKTGKFGVWHAMTQNWQIQDVVSITSYDTTGLLLLLGCNNGSIYNIDMQKFPLRMKDNDLLVTELYKDPAGDRITALSVYLAPKANQQFVGCNGNWIEIAYGTSAGTIRVIVQHPETLGQGPQLFQTFTVHCSPVTKVMISEKNLVSVCSDNNHVRTWSVTRFRGMISTQPGSMPLASFKIISIEDSLSPAYYASGNDFGPFGEKDDQQVFVQKVIPETDQLFVRLSSTGKRICDIKSVDGSIITAFCIHECEGSSRMGSRPRRYLFTGHHNGTIQIWDLSTALELCNKGSIGEQSASDGGPTPDELVHLVDQCDLTNSRCTTPSISPSPLLVSAAATGQCTPQTLRRKFLVEASSGIQATASASSSKATMEMLPGSTGNTSSDRSNSTTDELDLNTSSFRSEQ